MRIYTRLQSGFHLLDALIGILLLATILSVSIPSVSGAYTSQALRSESNYLELLLNRLLVQARQREKDLMITLKKTSYTAKEKGDSGRIIEKRDLKSGVFIDLGRARSKTLYFYASGTNQPATIVMRHNNAACEISISLRGRTRSTC